MSKTAAESWSSLTFYNLHRPKWTEQELPTSRMDRTLNKLGHNHEMASTSTCQHFNKLINHQPEDTQIKFFRAGESQTVLIVSYTENA